MGTSIANPIAGYCKRHPTNTKLDLHDSTWDIYTDYGFAAAISKALGYEVRFTEQGMQDDYCASMEA